MYISLVFSNDHRVLSQCNALASLFVNQASYDGRRPRVYKIRLQCTLRSGIFFKFGFSGQSSGRRIISNFQIKKLLRKTKYWRRNDGLKFAPEVKVYLFIFSPMARMQSTETFFRGNYLHGYHELVNSQLRLLHF